jgi:hypothetical protein
MLPTSVPLTAAPRIKVPASDTFSYDKTHTNTHGSTIDTIFYVKVNT